jgi:hypothetical protein
MRLLLTVPEPSYDRKLLAGRCRRNPSDSVEPYNNARSHATLTTMLAGTLTRSKNPTFISDCQNDPDSADAAFQRLASMVRIVEANQLPQPKGFSCYLILTPARGLQFSDDQVSSFRGCRPNEFQYLFQLQHVLSFLVRTACMQLK